MQEVVRMFLDSVLDRYRKKAQSLLLVYLSWLNQRRLLPVRTFMGDGKGKSLSRLFVDKFVGTHKNLVHGDVLEIGRNVYKGLLPPENITSYSCLDISAFPEVDIVADIQCMPQVESNQFDSIICTQVLEHVPDPFAAVNELYRILRPYGSLLITAPFLNNYHMEPDDYWRFTEYGLKHLLKEFSHCTVSGYGTTYHHVAATLGFTASEVAWGIPERADAPKFPVIVSAVAQK
jgi:SAM-dependent methyltransferase